MDIYKYKIWTGHIPGVSSAGCAKPSREVSSGGPTLSSDCSRCTSLSLREKIEACVECDNGGINVCCPNPGESCCGIILSPCDEFYSWDVKTQTRYCSECPKKYKRAQQTSIIQTQQIPPPPTNNTTYCECCNRSGRETQNSTLTIFLDHDFNDIGHYTM